MTTTHQPIIRMVPMDKLKQTLQAHGGWQLILNDVPAPAVRRLADDYRADTEVDGGPLADALIALVEETEASPVGDWDRPNPSAEHDELFRSWQRRAEQRSPLLESFASDLNTLWCAKDPGVTYARRALEVLAYAEKILPGVDEALRGPLSLYAGREAQ